MTAPLTEAEREALRDWWDSEPPECTTGMLARLDATVERILADRLAAATADYERRLDHAHEDHLRLRAALAAVPTWVCDTCMLRVHREQIAVWADGEHVVCQWCRRDEAEVEALRSTVARVRGLTFGGRRRLHIVDGRPYIAQRRLIEALEGP